MNVKNRSTLLFAVLLTLMALPMFHLHGQQSGSKPALSESIPNLPDPNSSDLLLPPSTDLNLTDGERIEMRPIVVTRTVDGRTVTEMQYQEVRVGGKSDGTNKLLRESLAKMKDANASSKEKMDARNAIEQFLKEQFAKDQQQRRERIEALEKQVAKLREQLDKREQSQSKIIELRMQLLDHDADGLSFPDSFNDLQLQEQQFPTPLQFDTARELPAKILKPNLPPSSDFSR